jgi:hypothetical protein
MKRQLTPTGADVGKQLILRGPCELAAATHLIDSIASRSHDRIVITCYGVLVATVGGDVIFFEFWHRQSSQKELENGMFRFHQHLWAALPNVGRCENLSVGQCFSQQWAIQGSNL